MKCILWPGSVANAGYGHTTRNGVSMNAHRAAYLDAHGSIPEGCDIDHLCRNPLCVNVEHLEAVTHRENCIRRTAHIASCPRGHEYDAHNSRGQRRCRECDKLAARRYRARAALAKVQS